MKRVFQPRLLVISIFVAAVAVFAAGVWWYGYVAALAQLDQRARSDLALASDNLTSELRRFRELAVLTADHPQMRQPLAGQGGVDDVRQVLQEIADKTGAMDIMLVNRIGMQVVSTAPTPARNHSGTEYFERALDGALGVSHQYSADHGRRAFIFAAPIFAAEGPVWGAIVVFVDIEAVEASWRGARPAVFFTDELGIVFVSNRSELVLRSRQPQAATNFLVPFISYDETLVRQHEVWNVDGGPYIPDNALHLTLSLPQIGMTGEVLLDVAPARQLATLQAAVAAALCLAFGALLFLATERRRTLALANRRLETRVKARTSELSALNDDLRREVAERRATQQQLHKAQDELVQAGKLSALGQMSAGISHELNQPLTAIRSFAENAQGFLIRGNTEVAAQNLGRISELARRMGRIIRNLRAFAKQESEPLKDVDIVPVIEAVLEMATTRAKDEGVDLRWNPPEHQMMVRGGEVRLQQVVMNLVSNAMDAMEGRAEKVVVISVIDSNNRIELSVRDSGPGIDEPEKIFDPFYSTKAVGAAEGMGLGLSISYGLVQSFGGAIRGRNHADGGAVFTVELEPAAQEKAA